MFFAIFKIPVMISKTHFIDSTFIFMCSLEVFGLSVVHVSAERFIRSTLNFAGLLLRTEGSAVSNLVQFGQTACKIHREFT